MIKATELRYGNKVFYKPWDCPACKDRLVTISWVSDSQVGYIEEHEASYPHSQKEYSPIPLTEEWLAKTGFKIDDIEGYYFKDDICIVETDEGYHLTEADTFNEYSLWIGKSFKYVHQLQNLYFALTGEELTIKETA